MQELIELALKRIEVLEKKLERYYKMLKIDNEIDFILKGTYLMEEDLTDILTGEY